MIFECCFYDLIWSISALSAFTVCCVRRGLNTEKLYWGRILYSAGPYMWMLSPSLLCSAHSLSHCNLCSYCNDALFTHLHAYSCHLYPQTFPLPLALFHRQIPQLYLTSQSGKLALRMEYKWHHYVIFNLLLQQYPIPQIAPFTTRPICSGLAGPVLFMENIKELLN